MRKKFLLGGVGLGSLLIVLAGISPALGESDELGGTERPVMGAMETPSFGAEDWAATMEYSDVVGTGALPEPAR